MLARLRPVLAVLACGLTAAFVVVPLAVDRSISASSVSMYVEVPLQATPVPTPSMPEPTPDINIFAPDAGDEEGEEPLSTPQTQPTDETELAFTALFNGTTLELSSGETAEEVILLQTRLMELQYMDTDEPTTFFGPATKDALSRFQRVHGLEETGEGDAVTLSLLFSDDAYEYVLRRGDSSQDVDMLQQRLEELGYYAGYQNGYFGAATERALKAFQTKNGLAADGVLTSNAYQLVYSPDAKPKVDPTPTPTPRPTATPKPQKTATPKPSDTTPRPSQNTPKPSEGGSTITPPVVTGGGVDAMISTALAQIGRPYSWGKESPEDGFDCSGLVCYSLRQAGVSVGRLTADGFSRVEKWTYIGSYDELRRGDLVFFRKESNPGVMGHTGIYLGNGSFVHASSTKGEVVKSTWSNWCRTYFSHGRRVF